MGRPRGGRYRGRDVLAVISTRPMGPLLEYGRDIIEGDVEALLLALTLVAEDGWAVRFAPGPPTDRAVDPVEMAAYREHLACRGPVEGERPNDLRSVGLCPLHRRSLPWTPAQRRVRRAWMTGMSWDPGSEAYYAEHGMLEARKVSKARKRTRQQDVDRNEEAEASRWLKANDPEATAEAHKRRIELRMTEALKEAGMTVEDARLSFGRGRPTAARKAARTATCGVLVPLRDELALAAMADVLGIDRVTLHKALR